VLHPEYGTQSPLRCVRGAQLKRVSSIQNIKGKLCHL
jgi:hypothetical protein